MRENVVRSCFESSHKVYREEMEIPAKSPIPEHLRVWLDAQIEQGIARPDRCTVISDPEAVSAMTQDLKIRWQSQLERRAHQTIRPPWRRN